MAAKQLLLFASALITSINAAENLTCPDYFVYAGEQHGPFSEGRFNLSSQRPVTRCRTFNSSIVETKIKDVSSRIADPDLKRLFVNSFPNTLDTAVKWKGLANGTDEELTFLITGGTLKLTQQYSLLTDHFKDINAMWLRDSANQVQSYLPLLEASSSPDSLASLYRGVINLQSRYLLTDPYCNSFQPPAESGLPPSYNEYAQTDVVKPTYSNASVFECKYELDSLAAFLEVSYDYYNATQDAEFFGKYSWVSAVEAVLKVAEEMMESTYFDDGAVNNISYTWTRETTRSTETTANSKQDMKPCEFTRKLT